MAWARWPRDTRSAATSGSKPMMANSVEPVPKAPAVKAIKRSRLRSRGAQAALRRRTTTIAARPRPSSAIEPGSGTWLVSTLLALVVNR